MPISIWDCSAFIALLECRVHDRVRSSVVNVIFYYDVNDR